MKPQVQIGPCSWALGKLKNISIQTYFGTLLPILRGHFAVLRLVQPRNGCKLAIFFVASINCIF